MKNIHDWKSAHLIGIGGISMSAVAKILDKAGVKVTGSDVHESDITKDLQDRGIKVTIGPHDERNIPEQCDGVIHTSAAPENNPERIAAKNRNLLDLDNFQFLGSWFKGNRMVVVTGTHGKSTVTALLGQVCIAGGLDPTVLVGSKVPGWPDQNLFLGKSDLVIVEGDEYAKHFLEFHPYALIINNLELDHTDVYKNIDELRKTFERLLHQMVNQGMVIANGESEQINIALKPLISTKKIEAQTFGHSKFQLPGELLDTTIKTNWQDGHLSVDLDNKENQLQIKSKLLGDYNGMNIAAAVMMAKHLGVDDDTIKEVIADFPGIWRRLELVAEKNDIPIYSDYGHHPTAVAKVIQAMRDAYPDKRLVLCFQPHHKNRTKNLWKDFISCFDRADVLILCEIYDVAGRNAPQDSGTTSEKLLSAVRERDIARPLSMMEYAPDPDSAIKQTFKHLKPNDICIFMGAGDIDSALRKQLKST